MLAHFAAVLLYSWPEKNEKKKTYLYAFAYVYPYFHQNWNVFVPPPSVNFSVYVRYKAGSRQREWKDVFYELNSRHQDNRLGGHELRLLAFSNALRYYSTTAPEHNEVIADKNADANFVLLEHIVRRYIGQEEAEPVEDPDIIIAIRPLNGKVHYHYYRHGG